MKFIPREYQIPLAHHILKHPRCAIYAGMGMGKSSGSLYALDALRMAEDNKVLVVAPLRVARSVWSGEIKKWDFDFSISTVIGSAEERLDALHKKADIHTINYENLQWLHEQGYFPWETVISDESTKLKSFRLKQGSKRAKALARYSFTKVKRFIELTGTPAPNGLINLWGQLWFLDKGERLGSTYTGFVNRWFRYPHPNSMTLEPMPHTPAEIHERIKDICLSIRAEDYFDLKEPIYVDVPVDLPKAAMNQYKQMEKMMYLELEGKEIDALNAASKTIKCLQLANGAIYLDDSRTNWSVVHDAKLDALEDIIEEANGMPVLVAYHFKSDLSRLKKKFPQGRQLLTEKDEKDWNKGIIPVLFVHPASAGHGLNLQDGGNIIAFFGHWWDLEHYQQIIERIGPMRQMQSGYNRNVYIYNIRAVDTVDDLIVESRKNKRKVQDLLLEAASRKKYAL